jgi:signal peptidase I
MEESEPKALSAEPTLGKEAGVEAFSPKLTLATKRMRNGKRGVNFRRLYIGLIDFAGDQSTELGGITVSRDGGYLLPGPDAGNGLEIIERGDSEYAIEGRADEENPHAVFDLFPDGKSHEGEVIIEREGCESIEAKFEFTPGPLHWMFDVVESLVWAFFIAMLIRLLLFQTFFIPSGSMEPTLYEGDRIVANKLLYKIRPPKRGEVIIFKVFSFLSEMRLEEASSKQLLGLGKPSFRKAPPLDERYLLRDYIKRVAAVPGDEIEIRDKQLYVNGQPVEEPWITEPRYDFDYEYGPRVVPEGHVFVLGDNHRNSQDSHKLGFLPLENVVGKAIFVFYPPLHIKLIK